MAYELIGYVNDNPPSINATNLNHMDNGIKDAHDGINDINTALSIYPISDDIKDALRNIITIKFSEDYTGNLVDKTKLVENYYIDNDGNLVSVNGYYVTEYIPVYGKNIIGSWYTSAALVGYAVYDKNFNVIRTVKNSNSYNYTNGDVYIRCMFGGGLVPQARAFYGATLKPYSDFEWNSSLAYLDNEIAAIEIENRFQSIVDGNLIDKNKMITPYYLDNNGNVIAGAEGYYVTEFIPVFKTNISGSWTLSASLAGYAVYDKDFQPIRAVKNNDKYTYTSGDMYIRCMFNSVIYPQARAFYGDTLKNYSEFAFDPQKDAKDIIDLKNQEPGTGVPNTVKFIGNYGGCNYSNVQDALDDISDDSANKPYIFIVMPGVYPSFTMVRTNVQERTGERTTPRYISIIGYDPVNTIFRDNKGNYTFSPCEIYTNGTIANLTFETVADAEHYTGTSGTPAYAVHEDWYQGPYNTKFINCVMKSNAGPGAGVGTRANTKIEFYNCRFISDADGTFGEKNYGAFFAHTDGSGNNKLNQKLIMHDCIAIAEHVANGARFSVITTVTGGTWEYELQNVGCFGVNGAQVSITDPDNDLFSAYNFNNTPNTLNN